MSILAFPDVCQFAGVDTATARDAGDSVDLHQTGDRYAVLYYHDN